MMSISTWFSRNSIFKKLQLSDTPVYSSFFYNVRPYHREINDKVENSLRSEDSVNKDYRVIYRAPYVKYLRLTYGFSSISTSIVVPLVGKAVVTSGIGNYPVMMGDIILLSNSFEFTALIGAIILITSQLTYVVFKYPFRIYHNSSNNKYMAIYQHLLPWKKHKEEFNAGEVKKVEKSYSLWHDCLYEVKRKRVILLEDHFYVPQDFNDMFSSKEKKDKQF